MKILHFVQSLDMGGIENLIYNLAIKFDKEGHEIHVIAFQKGGIIATKLQERGIKVSILNISSLHFGSVLKVRKIFKEESPDLIHFHSLPAATLGRMALLFNGIPHFYHLHTQISKAHNFNRIMYLRERVLNKSGTHFIAVSNFVKSDYLSLFNISENSISVLSGGVIDIEPIDRNYARRLLGLQENGTYLAIVASLTPHKNHKYIFNILANLESVELLVAGDGPLKDNLQSYAEDLGIRERIHFLGVRDDINTIYSASDAAILTSTREGLGLSLIEGQRAALPCFGTPAGGIPEVIADGNNGFIIPRDNPTKAADIIYKLLSDNELMKIFGSESRKRFKTEYEMDHYYTKLLALYQDNL